jgi:hypothetical protein
MTDGGGAITLGGGAITEGVVATLAVTPELDELEVLLEAVPVCAPWALVVLDELEPVAALMTVVVEEVVMLPCTHFPLDRMSPSLLEQLLQPTPPSL